MYNKLAITSDQLDNMIKQGYKIIDVRYSFEARNIPAQLDKYVINIPYQDIINDPEKYFKIDDKIVFICNHGNRSNLAAKYLDHQGFSHVFVLEGGIFRYY